MGRSGRSGVRELGDGIYDPAPDRDAVVIAVGRELVDPRGAFATRSNSASFGR